MVLSVSELVQLTRRERPTAQARVLRRLGIPFKIHPSDGVLLVAKDAAAAALAGAEAQEAAPQFEVNLQAIRLMHGKTSQALKG